MLEIGWILEQTKKLKLDTQGEALNLLPLFFRFYSSLHNIYSRKLKIEKKICLNIKVYSS